MSEARPIVPGEICADLRSAPIRILSLAYSRSPIPTFFFSSCEALSAATFMRFEMSAPLNPGVARAIVSMSTSSLSIGIGLA